MSASSPVTVEEWRPFLTEYSREVLTSEVQALDRAQPGGGIITVPRFSPEVRDSGWLGSEPCSDAEITAAEIRLGRSLPPSFRNFYLVSNGWSEAGRYGEAVWRVHQVDWLRVIENDLIEAWDGVLEDDEIEMLRATLLIGYADGGAGDYWLLTPPESGDESEWTAYQWSAGAGEGPAPFANFGALMAAQR
jgi:hypothetical protein